jgi:hypothetical protein
MAASQYSVALSFNAIHSVIKKMFHKGPVIAAMAWSHGALSEMAYFIF